MLQSYTDAADVLDDEAEPLVVIYKPCISCSTVKPLAEYYAHSKMADGHLNKCKDCCRRDNSKTEKRRLSTTKSTTASEVMCHTG